MAAGSERFVPNDLFLDSRCNANTRGEHHRADRPEHGRQEHVSAAGGADRDHGADGLICSGACRAPWDCRPRLHAHWRKRQRGPRTLYIHGRDDGDGRDSAHGDGALLDPVRRSRARHFHLRRTGHRLGRRRVSACATCEPRLCLPRTISS